jgi:hypothetical protein
LVDVKVVSVCGERAQKNPKSSWMTSAHLVTEDAAALLITLSRDCFGAAPWAPFSGREP